jgi:hypothetical protein
MSLISYKKPTEFFSDTYKRMTDKKASIIRQHSQIKSIFQCNTYRDHESFTTSVSSNDRLSCVAVFEGTLVDSISHCTCTGFTVTAVLATSGNQNKQRENKMSKREECVWND